MAFQCDVLGPTGEVTTDLGTVRTTILPGGMGGRDLLGLHSEAGSPDDRFILPFPNLGLVWVRDITADQLQALEDDPSVVVIWSAEYTTGDDREVPELSITAQKRNEIASYISDNIQQEGNTSRRNALSSYLSGIDLSGLTQKQVYETLVQSVRDMVNI